MRAAAVSGHGCRGARAGRADRGTLADVLAPALARGALARRGSGRRRPRRCSTGTTPGPGSCCSPRGEPAEELERRWRAAGIEVTPAPFGAGLITDRSRPAGSAGLRAGRISCAGSGAGAARLVRRPGAGRHALRRVRGARRQGDHAWAAAWRGSSRATPAARGCGASPRTSAAPAADASSRSWPTRSRRRSGRSTRCWSTRPVSAPAPSPGIPDARWRVTPEALSSLGEHQAALLDHASAAVAPGGLLLYSTCSIEPEENARAGGAVPGAPPRVPAGAERDLPRRPDVARGRPDDPAPSAPDGRGVRGPARRARNAMRMRRHTEPTFGAIRSASWGRFARDLGLVALTFVVGYAISVFWITPGGVTGDEHAIPRVLGQPLEAGEDRARQRRLPLAIRGRAPQPDDTARRRPVAGSAAGHGRAAQRDRAAGPERGPGAGHGARRRRVSPCPTREKVVDGGRDPGGTSRHGARRRRRSPASSSPPGPRRATAGRGARGSTWS